MANDATRNASMSREKIEVRYSYNAFRILEKIFDYGWLSTGGEETAKAFFYKLKLRPGQKVLDIGSGGGGCAFYLARQYGVSVHGVDYSKDVVQLARERIREKGEALSSKIKFTYGDIMDQDFPRDSFDVIYSRDVIAHIREKEVILKRIKKWLKPGGQLLITDFCKGEADPSQEFVNYTQHFSFDLITVKEYGNMITNAGFKAVEFSDITDKFIDIHKKELKYFLATEEATVQEFGTEAYEEIVDRWTRKIRQAESTNEQAWGYFLAKNVK